MEADARGEAQPPSASLELASHGTAADYIKAPFAERVTRVRERLEEEMHPLALLQRPDVEETEDIALGSREGSNLLRIHADPAQQEALSGETGDALQQEAPVEVADHTNEACLARDS
jgi:hypothetical protein